ncbi:hypothetical protein AVEN_175133-1 [Araneus ventricosus]|uniref:Uncharacterized protein n=1 Tax=Araneus ventricosus TaxID=182803 RepID=A0A4Y2JZS4_ARAVE|nr:hypothetical protein AVEN_262178-1 [Araneus ventricosus]GBM95741.1 hypothetical protein AVEN_67817-1 [Araneus ventricosus]GBM95746.1 hypothetical protein AVEN_74515-1 [Araneus ventricosus]GBM95862.1 hypothetical protein AVEN_175133-1 [Araneus ventricosus]
MRLVYEMRAESEEDIDDFQNYHRWCREARRVCKSSSILPLHCEACIEIGGRTFIIGGRTFIIGGRASAFITACNKCGLKNVNSLRSASFLCFTGPGTLNIMCPLSPVVFISDPTNY